jgi:hypothetical protein
MHKESTKGAMNEWKQSWKGFFTRLEEKLAEKRNTVPNSGPPFFGSFVWWVLPFCVLLQTPLFYFPIFEPEIFRVSLNIHNIFSTVFGEHFRESTTGALQSMNLDEERMKSCGFDSLAEEGWKSCGLGLVKWLWVSIFELNECQGASQMPLHNLPLALDWLHRYINWSTLFATTSKSPTFWNLNFGDYGWGLQTRK